MVECEYKLMQQYLTKIQALQRKAAGKVCMWIVTPRDSGAIFGGIVSELDIAIDVTPTHCGRQHGLDYFVFLGNLKITNLPYPTPSGRRPTTSSPVFLFFAK